MKDPSYAILGMGRFGRKLTTMLRATGAQILIADKDQDIINHYAEHATYAVCLDLTNANALEDIGLDHIDIAVVDLSSNLEPAIMAITNTAIQPPAAMAVNRALTPSVIARITASSTL